MKQITISGQPFLISKEEQVLLRILAVIELKDPLILVSQRWKKIFQINVFVAFLLEIHLSYVGPNSQSSTKFVYNEKRALLEHDYYISMLEARFTCILKYFSPEI